MRRNVKEFIPSTSDIKIMKTVSLLNKDNLYPLAMGVYKILSGSNEEEYKIYSYLETYSTLISPNSRHIANQIVMLLRKGYLENIYSKEHNELYLKISTKGELYLDEYTKKHRYTFKKKQIETKPLIVRIKQ